MPNVYPTIGIQRALFLADAFVKATPQRADPIDDVPSYGAWSARYVIDFLGLYDKMDLLNHAHAGVHETIRCLARLDGVQCFTSLLLYGLLVEEGKYVYASPLAVELGSRRATPDDLIKMTKSAYGELLNSSKEHLIDTGWSSFHASACLSALIKDSVYLSKVRYACNSRRLQLLIDNPNASL